MFPRHARSLLIFLLSTGLACGDGSGQAGASPANRIASSAEGAPGATQEGATSRRLWMTTGWELANWWVDISPHGRRVVYEGVGVRNLETGETIPLTSDLYTEQPLFSPDGRLVAFAACCEPGYSLRIGPSDRAESRVLLNSVQGVDGEDRSIGGLIPLDWSPDGKAILVSFGYEPPQIIAEVSVEDGRYRVLGERADGPPKYFASRPGPVPPGRERIQSPKYSPDGRFLAFKRPVDAEFTSSRLLTLRLADETEIDLGQDGDLIGWSSDGRGVFYGAPGDEGVDVWFLPVRDGARAGSPRLIRSGLPTIPGWVADDRLFYIVTAEYPGLRTATLDLSSGRVLTPPTPVSDENAGDWSPDGQHVAYESEHDPYSRRGGFVVRSVTGNNHRDFPAPEGSNRIDWVRWIPGSDAIAAEIRMPVDPTVTTTPRHMMRLDVGSGRYTDLGPARLRAAEFAGDGTTLYTVSREGIVAVELGRRSGSDGLGLGDGDACGSGWPRDLGDCRTVYHLEEDDACIGGIGALDLSPDERELVAVTPQCVFRIPTSGGTPRVIHREPELAAAVQWTPDGEHILFIARSGEAGNAHDLKVIPAEGGEARTVISYPNLEDMRIHPDGRRILFYGGEVRQELWVLENLPGFGG